MDFILPVIVALVAAALAGWLGYRLGYDRKQPELDELTRQAEREAETIIAQAQTQAKQLEVDAKEKAVLSRDEVEIEVKNRRQELIAEERRLQEGRDRLDSRQEKLDRRRQEMENRARNLDKRESKIESLVAEQESELARIAELSREEARRLILAETEQNARQDMARILREAEMETKSLADKRAREIIITSMQRIGTDLVADMVVSTVELPSDDMKGRIIGRSGRNIRAIEQATGVDLVVDDTPEAVIISSFDPVRREVARVALSKLVADGRIHPARIEKVVDDARAEIEQIVQEAGEEAVYEAGVRGIHPELVKLLGQLKFRTSYGQNQWKHSIEASHLAALLAAELGADVEVSKKGALLHDIGKAVTHEVEGPHALIGAEIAKRCGVSKAVVNAIASHHHEVEQESIEAVIVELADAISGARPGARRETLDSYIKRIKSLEEIANQFDGVDEAYAIQAGREIRIIVRPDDVDDLGTIQLSRDISRKVEEGLEYPGQIKVTVVRETRAVDYAK
ncbi:MAG: ribonuclease Y [Anaerolineales bacterium]|nr:ribonuclease Y [Anaerolineales bacterium]MCB9128510.1 ribonuclease Y [Ardenticatenales bacterium]